MQRGGGVAVAGVVNQYGVVGSCDAVVQLFLDVCVCASNLPRKLTRGEDMLKRLEHTKDTFVSQRGQFSVFLSSPQVQDGLRSISQILAKIRELLVREEEVLCQFDLPKES
ncbi:hypothetical protein Pelo_13129 [Pelomyxa schiedti]|nr:hypothetical protein Pelo_13129 [Pelomyxa schiedti]